MKKKHYRPIILVLILALVTFLLASFGGNEFFKKGSSAQNSKSASTKLKTEKTNITFAQWSVPSTKLVEDRIDKFNETNKDNIHVNVLNIPLDRYIETLNMLNASGDGPDVSEVIKEWLSSYIIKGWAADLSTYVDNDFFKIFPEWAITLSKDAIDSKSKFYSIPSNQITYRLIYNKDLFKESGLNPNAPPKTLLELERYAKLISDVEKGKRKYGIAMPMGEAWMDFVQPMEALNCYSGVYYYDFKNSSYDLTKYEPWLKAFKNLNENGGLFPGMDTMKSDQAMAQFAEGNIGMIYAPSWEVSLLSTQFPPKCDWGVSFPPTIDESGISKGKIKVDTAGWNIINSKTEHFNESIKLWKFLYSADYLGDLFDYNSVIPIMSNIMLDSKHEKSILNFKAFLPGDNDSIYPNTPIVTEEWSRKNLYLAALTTNPKRQILLEESTRLNTLLNIAVTAGTLNINDYYYPDFKSQNPVKYIK